MSALVGRRYAWAMFDAAKEQNKLQELTADCNLISATLNGSRELVTAIKSPVVNSDKKLAILKSVFDGKISAQTMNVLGLLTRRGRADMMISVIAEFSKILDEENGILEAEVFSAVELDAAQSDLIQKQLESKTGKKIRLKKKINPDLIGGFTARIGDTVVDGSVKHQLERLRETFMTQSLN
jgi:F-type H+-transporting ATPase subunit delta